MEAKQVMEQAVERVVELPAILTANTFYWRPGRTARERRANELQRRSEVEQFLEAHKEILQMAGIEVEFEYYESCNHVYKRIKVWQNGIRKDVRALKKALGIK